MEGRGPEKPSQEAIVALSNQPLMYQSEEAENPSRECFVYVYVDDSERV